ncbi:unnamed protein product [Urochloa humidicola]
MTASSSRRRRRRDQKQREIERAADAARRDGIEKRVVELPDEIRAEIHRRLPFLKRLIIAFVCGETGRMLRPEAPCLILPGVATIKEEKKNKATAGRYVPEPEPEEEEETPPPVATGAEKSVVVSMADGESEEKTRFRSETCARTSGLKLLDRVIIGSSGGWLVTADERGILRMANPANGAQAALPAISTIPFVTSTGRGSWFVLDVAPFVNVRFGSAGVPPEDKDWGPMPPRTYTLTAAQVRSKFYRKVVLSSIPRPGSYTAMLIPDRHIGAPAFATAGDSAWRMAPSAAGVEDAIYHDGRFISISYAGDVEAWRRDDATGEFASEAVAPRLAFVDDGKQRRLRRKYLAVSPEGRLMAVLKYSKEVEQQDEEYRYRRIKVARVVFEVRVLDAAAGRWEAAVDIGDAALFVGVNGTVCVSASQYPRVDDHPGVVAGCVYYTDDEVGEACLRQAQGINNVQHRYGFDEVDESELRAIGVYSLKAGMVTERIAEKSDKKQPRWPPAAWFTPSFL